MDNQKDTSKKTPAEPKKVNKDEDLQVETLEERIAPAKLY